ncbi:MAG: tetratricopeptide repeat protein [Candidatus Kapabacteria bacterium]|nr:tetratricopeptide repeat protein [Candidatus Kapabacteria bacterium]
MDEDLRLAAIEASKLFKKGKYDDAVDICTLGISDYPQYSSLYLILAKSYLALGNVSEAHKVFESASKFFVNDPLINTLKEILEATPSINSEPPKKKNQLTNDPPRIVDEIAPVTIENQQIEDGTSISEEYSEPEIIIDEEIVIDEIKEDVDEFEEELIIDTLTEDFIEESSIETSTIEEESIREKEISIDDVLKEIANEIEVELQPEVTSEISIDDDSTSEFNSEFEDVLNGFDEIVSNLETEELYEEEHNDEFEDDESQSIVSISIKNDESLLFEIPPAQSSSNNFISKIRDSVTPIESLQFSVEKQQFLSVLPSLKVLSQSVSKVHHLDDFHISLENPLQDLDIVSTIANEPMVFEDSYKGKSRKYEDVVVFEHSIIGLDSLDSYVLSLGKKA